MLKIIAALSGFAVVAFAAEAPAPAGYELRGFFGAGDGLEVSVRNTADGRSQWLHVGKTVGNIRVEKGDAKAGSATVVIDGVRQNLRLAVAVAPEPEMPATKENLEKLMARQLAILKKPGVWQRAEVQQKLALDEFVKTHPEFEALKRTMAHTSDGPRVPTAEQTAAEPAYFHLADELNREFQKRVLDSGDPDLVESVRLGMQATEMSAKLPREFKVGFKESYGPTTDKPTPAN